jgi:cobyric acid synthase
VRGIVINNFGDTGYDVDELANDLTNLSGIEVLCSVPHVDDQKKISDVLAKNLLPKIMS